ncbi:MAG: DUF4268 domain-containing protein [Chloroflexota bacterium]
MPYLISNLLEGHRTPVTVQSDTVISEALRLMVENDFSQLPVVDEHHRPLGMVSNQSILRALNNFDVRLEELRAADAMVRVDTFSGDDDLFDVLSRLQDNSAVLIVDNRGILTGIVTDYDATSYFQRRAEDMMLIEDIEVMIRNIVLSVYRDESGEVDEAGLREAGRLAGTRNKPFERFSMYDYVQVFLHDKQWEVYGSHFTLSPEAINRLLDSVRHTRNQLAHFRDETTPQQRQQLRFCAEWLARYYDEIVNEQTERHGADVVEPDEIDEQAIGLQEDEPAPGESRYAPLAIWLQNQPPDKNLVKPSFDTIEEIISGRLPESAYKHRSWWENDTVNNAKSKQWLDVGWRVTSVSLDKRVARFARIKERQKAYIEFFSRLIAQLNEHPGFEDVRALSQGVSWHWVRSVAVHGRTLASFNYAFGRDGMFRVELYIDSGDATLNKALFDALHERREEIESKVGAELRWQRLDQRRASRIAQTFPGHITDSEEHLLHLRDQAVPAMVHFSDVLQEHVQNAGPEILRAYEPTG